MGVQAIATKAALQNTGWAFLNDFDDILVAALIGGRMRDFGWSAFWGWLGMAIVQIAVPVAFMIAPSSPSGATSSMPAIPLGAENLTFALLCILIGFAGLVKGSPGSNRYGPAPGCGPPAGKQQTEVDDDDASDVDAIIARSLAARSVSAVKAEANPRAAIAALARNPSTSGPPAFGKRR
jgi:hypothetical protein